MNVAYVLGRFPELTEQFVVRELRSLARAGARPYMFALRRAQTTKPEDVAPGPEVTFRGSIAPREQAAACVRFLREQPRRFASALRYAARPVGGSADVAARRFRNLPAAAAFAQRALAAGVTHIHAHFAHAPADVAGLMSRLTGLTYTVSAHAWDIFAQPPRRAVARLAGAGGIAVCSTNGAQRVRALLSGLAAERVRLIRHGIDVDDGAPPCDASAPAFISVGRLIPKKGFDTLLRACQLLRDGGVDVGGTIVGDGPLRRQLEARTRALRLDDRVRFVGFVTPGEVSRLYRQSGLFVLASRVASDGDCDGISNAMLEAMAAGLPVAATRIGGAPEAVYDGVNGWLVDADNPAMLADAMRRLWQDPALRREMGMAGRETVQRDFDSNRNIAGLRVLFDDAVRAGSMAARTK